MKLRSRRSGAAQSRKFWRRGILARVENPQTLRGLSLKTAILKPIVSSSQNRSGEGNRRATIEARIKDSGSRDRTRSPLRRQTRRDRPLELEMPPYFARYRRPRFARDRGNCHSPYPHSYSLPRARWCVQASAVSLSAASVPLSRRHGPARRAPAGAIRAAEDLEANLIVMATHGHTGLNRCCWAASRSGWSENRGFPC